MKISNKEKIMLYILGIIIIGFAYYQFVYTIQVSKIQEKTKQKRELEQKYTTSMNTINSIEDKKNDVKILKAKVSEESLAFYPTISQEHIILELDTLLNDSGLKGGIKFNLIVSDSVEAVNKKSESLAESSIQGIVDEYKGTSNNENKQATENNNVPSNSSTSNNNVKTNKTETTNNTKSSITNNSGTNNKEKKKNTVQYVKIGMNFEGSYEGLNKFLTAIEQRDKKIVINSIKISEDSLQSVKGTINLEIYSVPKISDELESYLKWDLNNTYGKSMPFDSASGVVQSNTDTDTQKTQETSTTGDFVASIKSITSDLPKVIVGKAKDSLKTSYIYGDSNSEEPVEMVLTQDGDKYYYKYKTSKGVFPTNYEGIGEEFIPISENIVLNILSENRVNSNDNSSIRIKMVNKTDKKIDVNIFGDDSSNPRVTIDGNENTVKVNRH